MIRIDIDPVAKPRQTKSDKWNKRPCVLKYRAFADELRLKCNTSGYKIGESIAIRFYIPMPKSWSSKRKREMYLTPHKAKPDIDNLIKSVLDALAKDDSFIYSINAAKFWDYDGFVEVYNFK